MEQREFDELVGLARQSLQLVKTIFEDLSEEELSLESAIRNYPITALGLALGAGALAGWMVGRRQRPALPAPEPDRSAGSRYLEQLMPQVDKLRKAVPDSIAEDASSAARSWMEDVLEPKLRERLSSMSASMSESRWGSILKQAAERMDSPQDVQLEDPEEPEG